MIRRSVLFLAAVCAVFAAALSVAVRAAPPDLAAKPTTHDVCPGLCAFSSIQAAINASLDGDTIRVAGSPGSAYAERLVVTKTISILGGYSGPPGWQRDIGTYATVVNGQGSGTVVEFPAGAATFEGFTITGGQTDLDGGGILIEGASPLISATTVISNNASSSGGGIAIKGGAPHLVNDLITGNTAMGGGGLLLADSADVELRDSTVSNNQAYLFGGGLLVVNGAMPRFVGGAIRDNHGPSGGGLQAFDASGSMVGTQVLANAAESGYGGGLNLRTTNMSIQASAFLSNTATLDGGGFEIEDSVVDVAESMLQANHARSGGGAYLAGAPGVFAGNIVTGNFADDGSGGGIALDRTALSFRGNTVVSNTATLNGGGIEITGYFCPDQNCANPIYPTVVNTIIDRNTAGGKGGGVHVDTGAGPTLLNNTIVGNSLEGIFVDAYAQAGITNTIVVSNGQGIRALDPSAPSADYNLVWGNPAGNYVGTAPGIHGIHDLSVDPIFVAPVANDFHLMADSPAIDAGTNVGAPGSDRDGNVRPLQGRCTGQQTADIGAYEFMLQPGACATPSATPTLATPTASATLTPPSTATPTGTRTQTATSTALASATATATATASPTATRTLTATATGTRTLTATVTATRTPSPSLTATPTRSLTATETRTSTRTVTATTTNTRTPEPTATPSLTPTPTQVLYHLYLPVISSNLLPDCAAHEPNDSMDTAWGPLVMGMQYRSYLCFYDSVDWYYFDVTRAGAVAVDLIVPDRADENLSLHAADGSIIAQSNAFGEGVAEHIITVVQSAGRYYVRVSPFTRRDPNAPYLLTVNFF